MVTEYGKILRKIRVENGEILGNMAEKLKISSAYLSSIETGTRRVPENLTKTIAKEYKLSDEEAENLVKVEIGNLKEVKTIFDDSTSNMRKETALIFARTFNNINESNLQKIREILLKSEDN